LKPAVFLRSLVLLLCLSALTAASARAQSVNDFLARTYTDAQGTTLPYRLFVPAGYDPTQKYPLVLFLHGLGGSGNDNVKQLTDQTAPLVFVTPANQALYPCFMVAPQCPAGSLYANTWAGLDWTQPTNTQLPDPNPPLRVALEIVDALQQEFSLDSNRLYITGFSMGGFGVWDAVTRYPGKFAAAVPICGGGDEYTAPRIVNLAVWTFHSADDPVISVNRTRNMVAAMRAAGGSPLYTEYNGYGHFSWIPAYAEPNLLPWMFAQTRPDPPPNQPPTVQMTTPTNGLALPTPASFTLRAQASDSDGTVRKVDFYAGSTLLGTSTNRPFAFTWRNPPPGHYTLIARATDNQGGITASAPVTLTFLAVLHGNPMPLQPALPPLLHTGPVPQR
jgi:poly(3-hydroxybutyrate) depolymerase